MRRRWGDRLMFWRRIWDYCPECGRNGTERAEARAALADVEAAEKSLPESGDVRDEACLAAMAEAVGVDIGTPPRLEDFLPKGEGAKREGAKGAKKSEKKAKRKGARR